MRKNEKEHLLDYENSISKSNELSMAKLNQGLTLNQMQLLAFAIYSTQKNGSTEFRKVDFEEKFDIEKYQTAEAKKDAKRLFDLEFTTLEEEEFDYLRVFQRIRYIKGTFIFEWANAMLPHISALKENYVVTDLTVTSKFKSSFSWTLYEYLKAHYGYWHKPLSKNTLMRLFGVHDKKAYVSNTSDFKKAVLDVAINEINQYTELEVRYNEMKKGRAIVGFDLIWSNGKNVASATKSQIQELKATINVIFEDVFKYVNLNNVDNRQRAIDLIREVEEMRLFTEEPICITKEKADFSIQKANSNLKELERMVEAERNTTSQAPSFYNWLEERE